MGIFDWWRRMRGEKEGAAPPGGEERDGAVPADDEVVSAQLLRALVGDSAVTREMALAVPAVAACVGRISDTVASLDVKLYRRSGDEVEEAPDRRSAMLNADTGDTLDGFALKKSMVADMYLGRGGYCYVNRGRFGEVASLHYVDERDVSFQRNADPIFKDYRIMVRGRPYEGWEFIKLLRGTRNGYEGTPFIVEQAELLSTAYAAMEYERALVKTGGNKKGFVKAAKRLTEEALSALKSSFRNLYSNSTENVIVLNDGLDFKEASNTSVEMQLNENKRTNADDVCRALLVPPSAVSGNMSEADRKAYHEGCILPLLRRFEAAIDAVLLTEAEKEGGYFFAFDTTDMLRGSIAERFDAYETALRNGFMLIDEVRQKERLPAFGLDFIKLGLQDVLYYPETKTVYTPNTGVSSGMEAAQLPPGGGQDDADRGQG